MYTKIVFLLELIATLCAIGLGINKIITLISNFKQDEIL